jgi:membrane protease subunit HflK
MPWKEPGEKPREPRGREPWGPGNGGQGGGPDLEAWLRKVRRRLGPFGRGPTGVLALVVLVIVLWFLIGGWVAIDGQQVGVVSRFGRVTRVLQPGLHLRFPSPVERVTKLDVGHARTVNDEARMLTRDGQLVLVDYAVHYKITDPRAFLFATRDAEDVVRNAATAAVRAAVGAHALPCLIDVLDLPCPSERVDSDRLAAEVLAQLRARLPTARDRIGIDVTDVGVQGIGVPTDVKAAFDAIAKAHDDARTAQVAARADVARGKVEAADQAVAIKTQAEAYRRQVVADANASAARFAKLLPEYQAAPQVTQHRLWLDAMHDVMTRNHVVVNTGSGNVIVQFPVQRVGAPASAASSAPAAASSSAPSPASSVVLPITSGPGVTGVD